MKKFTNVQEEDNGCLLLYGEVADDDDDGRLSSREVVERLMNMDSRYKRIEVHINSVGGEVYPGIAIFNALRRCKSDVVIYIDGIAASIAGIIALCGRRVEMSRYARIMLHSVSGGCYGNKQDLRELIADIEQLEDMIAGIVAGRCHKTKEDVKAEYFDGKDHWLTADEALRLGMADAVYDVDETVPDGATADDIYRIFTNRLGGARPQKPIEMKLEDLKRIPRYADCASEEEALRSVQATAERVAALEQENAGLKEEAERLRQAALEEQERRVADTVEAAVADGRIGASQKETYTNILKADFESGQAALKALRPKRMVRDELETGAAPSKGTWEKRQEAIRSRYDRRP